MVKHIIWTTEVNVNDYKDFLEEEYPEITDDFDKYCLCVDLNNGYLEDERANLNIDLHREIICLGALSLWNGTASGYKVVRGTRVSDCLGDTVGDYVTWYVDERGDLRCSDTHHDGTNEYTYRVFREGLSAWQKDNFKAKIFEGTATRRDVNRYTERLGDVIADVYGFKIRKLPKRV